jgi:hypothetical protein
MKELPFPGALARQSPREILVSRVPLAEHGSNGTRKFPRLTAYHSRTTRLLSTENGPRGMLFMST